MSICRWGCDGSDIYLYEHCDNYVCCCGCSLNGEDDKQLHSDISAHKHLREHIENGDYVTQGTIDYFEERLKHVDFEKLSPKGEPTEYEEKEPTYKAELMLTIFDGESKKLEWGWGANLLREWDVINTPEEIQHKMEQLLHSVERVMTKSNTKIHEFIGGV